MKGPGPSFPGGYGHMGRIMPCEMGEESAPILPQDGKMGKMRRKLYHQTRERGGNFPPYRIKRAS